MITIFGIILCSCDVQDKSAEPIEYLFISTYTYGDCCDTETTDNIKGIDAKIDDISTDPIVIVEMQQSAKFNSELQIDIYNSEEKNTGTTTETIASVTMCPEITVSEPAFEPKYYKYFQIYKDIPLESSVKELVFEYCEYYNVPVYMAIACMDVGSHFDSNFHNELQLRWGLMCTRWDFVPDICFNPITRTVELPVEISLEVGIDALMDYIEYTSGDWDKIAMCFEWGGIASARNLWKSGGGLSDFSRRLVDKFQYYKTCEDNYA